MQMQRLHSSSWRSWSRYTIKAADVLGIKSCDTWSLPGYIQNSNKYIDEFTNYIPVLTVDGISISWCVNHSESQLHSTFFNLHSWSLNLDSSFNFLWNKNMYFPIMKIKCWSYFCYIIWGWLHRFVAFFLWCISDAALLELHNLQPRVQGLWQGPAW